MQVERWKYRLNNYERAMALLEAALKLPEFSDLEKEGVIQRFEYTHELAWKLMKDFLTYEGMQNIMASRSATREAFNKGLIDNADVWLQMIETRNQTVHNYDMQMVDEAFADIKNLYHPLLKSFLVKMKTL